jgi:hypothetical protein
MSLNVQINELTANQFVTLLVSGTVITGTVIDHDDPEVVSLSNAGINGSKEPLNLYVSRSAIQAIAVREARGPASSGPVAGGERPPSLLR